MTTLTASVQRPVRRSPFDARSDLQFATLVRGASTTTGRPAAEVARDGDDAVVRLDLPGVTVEDVAVEVDGDVLVVRGERKDTREEQTRGRSEVRYGAFRRSFTLPAQVAADAVSASYDAGVLSVRVAGAHRTAQPTRITVTTATATPAETTTTEPTTPEATTTEATPAE